MTRVLKDVFKYHLIRSRVYMYNIEVVIILDNALEF